ncbi:DNA polymerase Y family protein [Streptomyces sp. BI20]|uniref:DNA polymerase Y family protein n=1 Tax=Streptomyces sp. BI20 TaxID=3403460 RepID=UPI003C760A1F
MSAVTVLCLRAPGPEETWQTLLALVAEITPTAEARPPHTVLAEVSGSVRMLGRDPAGIARLLRVRALALYGLDCAIGVAPNPMLAAMAGPPGPGIRTVDDTPEAIAAFLGPRPVTALTDIGRAAARTLTGHGLDRIGKVAATPEATLRRILGPRAARLVHDRARGLDPTPVTPGGNVHALGVTRSFDRHELDAGVRDRALLALAADLGRRLRAEDRIARALTLTVRHADRALLTRTRRLPEPTAHTPLLIGTARALHESLGLQRARVTGLSLRAEEVTAAGAHTGGQLTLDRGTENARRLEPVLDRIAARWPTCPVGPAAALSA